MKIILLKDIKNVGKKFDIKEVNDGHALNMLIPRGLAIPATASAVKRVEADKAKMAGEMKIQHELLVQNIKAIEATTLTLSGKANDKGHLFAGIHSDVIVKELHVQARIEIDPSFIQLEHPLKTVGEHVVTIQAEGKSAQLKVVIKAL
ncbi:MAG TPA: 50S ribosomal protein L9 [Candidatus Paceibacterota bacterium]|jgi:large subunit ribosomal protein L9|nr:50S ribosomal protein L9 [Candidatus Paceibacterota bacterium]